MNHNKVSQISQLVFIASVPSPPCFCLFPKQVCVSKCSWERQLSLWHQGPTLSAPSSTAACCNVHLSWCYQYWLWLAFWQAFYNIRGWCSNSGNERVQFYFFPLQSVNKSTEYKVLIILLSIASVIKPLSELIWHSLQPLNSPLSHIRDWLPTAVVGLSTSFQ